VDDCVDGIEMIQQRSRLKPHSTQKYIKNVINYFKFVGDLSVRLKQFFDFPFHKIMDEPLADITYRFSKEKLPLLLEKMKQIKQLMRSQCSISYTRIPNVYAGISYFRTVHLHI